MAAQTFGSRAEEHSPGNQVEAARAEMSVIASEFQAVLDVIRVWWQESFEALKVNGQYALCEHERAYETLARASMHCSKRALAYASRHASTEYQQRGVAHMHILPWAANRALRQLYLDFKMAPPANPCELPDDDV